MFNQVKQFMRQDGVLPGAKGLSEVLHQGGGHGAVITECCGLLFPECPAAVEGPHSAPWGEAAGRCRGLFFSSGCGGAASLVLVSAPNDLGQGSANVLCEGPDCQRFLLCRPHGLSRLLGSAVPVGKQPWTVRHEWARLCSNKTLCTSRLVGWTRPPGQAPV